MAFSAFDSLLKLVFKADIKQEKEFFHSSKGTDDIVVSIQSNMEAIDSKSSALLTHISIMLAVLGFFLSSQNNHLIVQVALITELIFYLLISMALMRCIDMMGPPFKKLPSKKEDLKDFYYSEVSFRRSIYHFSVRASFILTAVLIPVILLKYIFYVV